MGIFTIISHCEIAMVLIFFIYYLIKDLSAEETNKKAFYSLNKIQSFIALIIILFGSVLIEELCSKPDIIAITLIAINTLTSFFALIHFIKILLGR